MKSLRLNIGFNYLSQLYVALIGILLIPVFLRLMGADAYGLVAFFLLVQAWFQILDIGLGATIARETARFLGGGSSSAELRRLLRCMELLFWGIGLVAALAMMVGARAIAGRWLGATSLPAHSVELSLQLIAFAVATRWMSGLYRSAISGLERQVWLSVFNISIVSLRFVAVIPVLMFVDAGPVAFFLFQGGVSVLELAVLWRRTYQCIPRPQQDDGAWSWQPLRAVFRFSASVAFTSSVWVLVTQTDKLLISRFLPLAEFGYFTAAVLLANGVMLFSGPIAQALLPRLTRLQQQGLDVEFVKLYRQATQAIAAICGAVALLLAALARPALWAWTGDAVLATEYANVLSLYALGNGLLSLAAFPYYLQYAKGDLRLHLYGNVVFVCVLLPAIVLATSRFGALGAAVVWAVTNALFFLAWTPFVHSRFLPGLHRTWLLDDVVRVLALPSVAAVALWLIGPFDLTRSQWLACLPLVGLALFALAFAGASLLSGPLRLAMRRTV